MGDVGDWSAILDALLAEVQEDASCKKLLADLQGYAVYAVTKNEADIRDTIQNRVKEACLKHLVFFVLFVPHQASVFHTVQGQKLACGCLWSSGSRSCMARLEQEVFIMHSRSSREPSHQHFSTA